MAPLKLLSVLGSVSLWLAVGHSTVGQEPPTSSNRPIPSTRPAMKISIEEMKYRTPRIPLPTLTAEEEAILGDRSTNYEARLRYHYLDQPTGNTPLQQVRNNTPSTRTPDPEATLSYAFKVQLFWIVSRTNNCQYCIGHQETKLLAAGMEEDQIAALDCDWSQFNDAEQAAFAFARKYTLSPHELTSSDVEDLKRHYTDSQVLEMCLSMSWNNAINRWKEGIGVPQSADEGGYSRLLRTFTQESKAIPDEFAKLPFGSYLTDTARQYQTKQSIVAPLESGVPSTPGLFTPICRRPKLESSEEVLRQLQAVSERKATLELLNDDIVRERLQLSGQSPVENWMRLICRFPKEGVERATKFLAAEAHSELSPVLRAEIAWIVTRQDRAWYSLARARTGLITCGVSSDDIAKLDGDWSNFPARERALFVLAQNLAASPVVLTDEQVEQAVNAAGPRCVVQVIDYVTQLAAFNRITEAAQLPCDPQFIATAVRSGNQ